jgi:hypothetical protein
LQQGIRRALSFQNQNAGHAFAVLALHLAGPALAQPLVYIPSILPIGACLISDSSNWHLV